MNEEQLFQINIVAELAAHSIALTAIVGALKNAELIQPDSLTAALTAGLAGYGPDLSGDEVSAAAELALRDKLGEIIDSWETA